MLIAKYDQRRTNHSRRRFGNVAFFVQRPHESCIASMCCHRGARLSSGVRRLLAPRGIGGALRRPVRASALLHPARLLVLAGSASPALRVPASRSLPVLMHSGSTCRARCPRPCSSPHPIPIRPIPVPPPRRPANKSLELTAVYVAKIGTCGQVRCRRAACAGGVGGSSPQPLAGFFHRAIASLLVCFWNGNT